MSITPEQRKILDGFSLVRVRDVGPDILQAVKGRTTDGFEDRHLIDCFMQNIEDDKNGHIASFVVLNSDNLPLILFSLRCGELYEAIDHNKLVLAMKAHDALRSLSAAHDSGHLLPPDEDKKKSEIIFQATRVMSIDEIIQYSRKGKGVFRDKKVEPCTTVSRVSFVYPSVELMYFITNEAARSYWKSIGMMQKMGETLFWAFIIKKVEDLLECAGCQYLFLFAADSDADGSLVTYYKTRLLNIAHNSQLSLSVNKPSFDWNSYFLYQDISDVMKQRDRFFAHFNDKIR